MTEPAPGADVLCVLGARALPAAWLSTLADEHGVAPHVARVSACGEFAVITGPRARVTVVRVHPNGPTVLSVAVDGTA
ncbi:hypothetical protein [Actinokineospora sp.]|uniref:hypothetical protein n=1 Tax=Actinokineospora sp. TaxID=1872133 RepID=UPI0040378FAB